MINPNDLFITNYFQLEVYLSFILLFALIFIVLNNTKFFSVFVNGAISLGISVLIIAAHYTGISFGCFDFVNIIRDSTSGLALMILVIVVIIILIGTLGMNLNITKYIGYIISVLLIITLILFFSVQRQTCNIFDINLELLKKPWVIFLIVIASIVLWIMSGNNKDFVPKPAKYKDSDLY